MENQPNFQSQASSQSDSGRSSKRLFVRHLSRLVSRSLLRPLSRFLSLLSHTFGAHEKNFLYVMCHVLSHVYSLFPLTCWGLIRGPNADAMSYLTFSLSSLSHVRNSWNGLFVRQVISWTGSRGILTRLCRLAGLPLAILELITLANTRD